jgi:hypothetical protein
MISLLNAPPILTAIGLLAIGILRRRPVLFYALFPALFLACAAEGAGNSSSGSYDDMGGLVLAFGLACVALSTRLKPGAFVSARNLSAIGALLCFIGMMGLMVA